MQTTTLSVDSIKEELSVFPVKSWISELKAAVTQELNPIVQQIDQEGYYPREFMQRVGALQGFGQAVEPEFGGSGRGLKAAIQAIEAISETCLCTGFMTWCQIACTWYMQNSDNPYLKTQLLPQVARGQVLGGTGLSNPMKHFATIEKIALTAERRPGGFILNGLLPWVSNIGTGQPFGIAAKLIVGDGYLMAIASDEFPGLTLRQNDHFIALEGSGTFTCVFNDVFIPDEWILAAPCEDYVNRIRPGFILTQVGMGLGLTADCIKTIESYQSRLGHVNGFLEDSAENLTVALEIARSQTYSLADRLSEPDVQITPELLKEVIQVRLAGSELSLRAANAAMLHAGARAYLKGSKPARRLREAYFIAIVTPAIKQLKMMLHYMEQGASLNGSPKHSAL